MFSIQCDQFSNTAKSKQDGYGRVNAQAGIKNKPEQCEKYYGNKKVGKKQTQKSREPPFSGI